MLATSTDCHVSAFSDIESLSLLVSPEEVELLKGRIVTSCLGKAIVTKALGETCRKMLYV